MSNAKDSVWWKCSKCGYEVKAAINNRCKSGCPNCGRIKRRENALKHHIDEIGSLARLYPDLAEEWNEEKNGMLNPNMFSPMSHNKVWWKCKKGHEWQAVISSRSIGGGCPYCSNKKTLAGYNDLATTNPKLASEWNYEKNVDLKPEMFTAGAAKKVWWKCKRGHEWQATINHRTNRNQGCPYCAGLLVVEGENDLRSLYPDIANQWAFERNRDLKPEMFKPGSGKKVWWRCEQGHEWEASIADRAIAKHNCPICSNQKVLPGFNDLLTTNPELTKEWDFDKNGNLKPDMFTAGSGKKVWWKCSICGNSWQTAIRERKRCGCPHWRHHHTPSNNEQ